MKGRYVGASLQRLQRDGLVHGSTLLFTSLSSPYTNLWLEYDVSIKLI